MFCCQVQSPMLQPQGVPVESELHVELHIADENLQQPETEQWWECELMLWVKFFIYDHGGINSVSSMSWEKKWFSNRPDNSWFGWFIKQIYQTFAGSSFLNQRICCFGMSIGKIRNQKTSFRALGHCDKHFFFFFLLNVTLFRLNTNRLVVIIISRLIAREKYSLSSSYCFEKPSLTLSSSTLWTYPLYTVIGSTLSSDLCTLRQSPRSTDGRFSATPGTCWRIQMLAVFLLCIMFLLLFQHI